MLVASLAQAQQSPPKDGDNPSGRFTVGGRSVMSLFSSHDGSLGVGTGGQFRLLLTERIDTVWFADWIESDEAGLARRRDLHLGWSVLFYPLAPRHHRRFLHPFIVAGHCFDHTRLDVYDQDLNAGRWSSAVQAGGGLQLQISDRVDLSLTGQFMAHLGDDLHVHQVASCDQQCTHLESRDGARLEGHLLTTLAVSVRLGELW
jgi:hypothetical protein